MKTSIHALIKQHSFLFFILLAVLISWFPWYSTGSGFVVFGPSIAGVITIALTTGKEGMRDLTQRALRWRVGLRWWAAALFASGIILFAAIAINTLLLGGDMPTFAFLRQEWHLIPVVFLMTLLGGPLGEEFGWRGFALPTLQNRWGAAAASIIIGTVWALWHLPLFFQADSIHAQIGLPLLPVYLVGEIVLATIMTWVYNNTGGSVLVGGIILHNADNFWATALLTNDTVATAGSELSQLNLQLYVVATVVGVLAVFALAAATKWQLGFKT